MFIDVAVISYATGGLVFLLLMLVLLTGQRGRPQKTALLYAATVSAVWMFLAAYVTYRDASEFVVSLMEPVRDLVLITFLTGAAYQRRDLARRRFRQFFGIAAGFALLLMSLVGYRAVTAEHIPMVGGIDLLLAGYLCMAIVGLVLIEQLYRNSRPESRRACKYLCMGVGGLFAYDFYIYSYALLFQGVNSDLWAARGFANALVVPVLGIAVARDPQWSQDIFVSRRMVFHTTALLGTGIYLLAMGVGGYYVRNIGGSWGVVAQVIFLFGAALILVILMFSRQVRATLRVLINKHFFHYRYDYRDEWLRFIETLSTHEPEDNLGVRAIRSIAEIIDSPWGMLWMRQDSGRFEPVASWNTQQAPAASVAIDPNSPLIRFMESRNWLINLSEYEHDPGIYTNLNIPGWLRRLPDAWLVAPLPVRDQLVGFVVLAHPVLRRDLNWEDYDLVKTVGRQVAVHLAQLEASRALGEAQQFEVCNRLSAYVMHDLKNLIAQLSLVVTNAARHKHNPQFMEDAIRTVENSVDKMNRLLNNLRSDSTQVSHIRDIEVCRLLQEVVATMSAGVPVPRLDCQTRMVHVTGDRDRFAAVIGHLIRNAQDATPADGRVIVRLFKGEHRAIIEVQDTGCGMDEEFIRTRLFRPFDSTKGSSGMGIGVYETREFVQNMGGQVEVISRPGEGTTFRLRLPISDPGQNTVKSESQEKASDTDVTEYKEIAGHRG
jgi:putative PEP-CTERM system histidine kinase